MYLKNTAGQYLYFTLINATTGAPLTSGTVTAYRTTDGGSQTAVTGTITHKGSGQWQLALSQADTNGDEIGFLFTITGGIPVSITIVTDTIKVGALSFGDATAANQATIITYADQLLARLTATRAALLDNLDASITSRLAAASYTTPNNAAIAENQADLNAIIATLNQLTELYDLLDELTEDDGTGHNRYSAKALEQAPAGGGTGTGDATAANQATIIAYVDQLEARLTATRAALLDNLANLDTAVSTRSSHSAPDLANLDAPISSRLAAASYTAPANTTIASILTDTNFLQQLLAELITGTTPNRLFTALALANAPSSGSSLSLADFFATDTSQTAATAVPGSVVGEIVSAISGGGVAGSTEVTDITINVSAQAGTAPIEGAALWITTDPAGANVIWSGTTNASGQPKDAGNNNPFLDPGTYYIWVQLGGYTFINPTTHTVSE